MGRLSALDTFPVLIQRDTEDEYIRVFIRGTLMVDGYAITVGDLTNLFQGLGFPTEVQMGVFGGEKDDQYDDDDSPIFVQAQSPHILTG